MENRTNLQSSPIAELPGRAAEPTREHSPAPGSSRGEKVQLFMAVGLTALVVAYFLLAPSGKSPAQLTESRPAHDGSVKLAGPRLIAIQAGHSIEKKLQSATVEQRRISVPLLTATGTVAASLRPGADGRGLNAWQFSTPEALTTYTDWQKAKNDVVFTENQLATIRELVDAKVQYQKKYQAKLVDLEGRGSSSEQKVAKVKLDTIEAELAGQKDIHEAENAVRLAKRSEAALALQLEQAGLEPDLLLTATPDMDIVMADVPLGSLSYVKLGQECKATFVGVRGHPFDGHVNKIVPVISKERRSLRVLFVIHDPEDLLRPGMFAEIELGTDAHDALLAPAEGLVHVGRADYFLVAAQTPGEWRITEVQVGEPYDSYVEVLDGLNDGDRVLGAGAILLKPVVARSLQSSSRTQAGANR